MSFRECVIVAILMTLAGTLVFVAMKRVNRPPAPRIPPPIALAVSTNLVLGPRRDYRGDAKSPYILVEFGDYQCPPCSAADAKVKALLQRYPGKLCFLFRHFPLVRFHPQATAAAIAAESARKQGKFWPTHDALFACDGYLGTGNLAAVARKVRLKRPKFDKDKIVAAKAVAEDVKAATALHLDGTPTYFLCRPDRRVLEMLDISQVAAYLNTLKL